MQSPLPPQASAPVPEPQTSAGPPGDLAIWIIILAELATFAVMFVSYAVARSQNLALFNESQRTLDTTRGAINTWLLLGGSWCVVRALQSIARDARGSGVRWLLAAQACGLGFLLLKAGEYADKVGAGYDLDTNTFFTFYFLLTGFHFFHVIAAMVFLAALTVLTSRGRYGRHDMHALETGAAFWHMVDLLWLVLFPLIYVMR